MNSEELSLVKENCYIIPCYCNDTVNNFNSSIFVGKTNEDKFLFRLFGEASYKRTKSGKEYSLSYTLDQIKGKFFNYTSTIDIIKYWR